MSWEVLEADCLDAMRAMDENSVDAVVTDPPAGISFMGRDWDSDRSGGFVEWLATVMREALRVTKPGGHALVWALPRTSHWTGSAIEGAGWEIRDRITHHFGSGFPKSLDVSKAIDRAAPRAGMFDAFAAHFREQREASGLSQKEIAKHFPSKTGGLTGCVWNWENGANVPTPDQWATLQPFLDLSDEWLPLIERVEAGREKVGEKALTKMNPYAFEDGHAGVVDITAPATPEAQRWQGWGTALKPATEDWWLARKPLIGTVARNVSEFGTGALNIDGCRIEHGQDVYDDHRVPVIRQQSANPLQVGGAKPGDVVARYKDAGRWPANVVLSHLPECERVGEQRYTESKDLRPEGQVVDHPGYVDPVVLDPVEAWRCAPGCPVAELDRQSGEATTGMREAHHDSFTPTGNAITHGAMAGLATARGFGDTGGASRFFATFGFPEQRVMRDENPPQRFRYVAKASRAERNAGLDGYAGGDSKMPVCQCPRNQAEAEPPRATDEDAEGDGRDSSTIGSGNKPTARSPKASKSTTSTATARTTDLRTSPSSPLPSTSESTPPTSGEPATDGSGAAQSAGSGGPPPSSTSTRTTEAGFSTDAADPATSQGSSRTSSADVCPDCGGVRSGALRNAHPT